MCGQAGVIRIGEKPINVDLLKLLLVGNEHRGNDATGIAISQADGSISLFKDDEAAWKFVCTDEFKKFMSDHLKPDSWAVLLHTRAATKGSPRNNNNNHPMFKGCSAVVHNGVIYNDDSLFRQHDWERSAETDSDILRAFIDEYGLTEEAIKEMNAINGSAAGAALHPDFPQHLMLFRSGSPMVLASNDDFMVWSSEKSTIHRAMRPWKKRMGIFFQEQRPEIAFSPMADDSAWIIGENGLKYHGKFKSLGHQYNEPNRRTYEAYKQRQTKWDADEQRTQKTTSFTEKVEAKYPKDKWDDAVCPDCKMEWFIPKGGVPNNFYCNKEKEGCGSRLSYKSLLHTVN